MPPRSMFQWWLCTLFRGHKYVLIEHAWPNGRYHYCQRCGDSIAIPRVRIPGT